MSLLRLILWPILRWFGWAGYRQPRGRNIDG